MLPPDSRLVAAALGALAAIALATAMLTPLTATTAPVTVQGTGAQAPAGALVSTRLPAMVLPVPSGPLAPGPGQLVAYRYSVTVNWYDRSSDEQSFVVYRRDADGTWQPVDEVPTRNVAGSGERYAWVDTDLSLGGQCYMIAAVNAMGSGSTAEGPRCVRIPPRFR
jgi:hypothetical protein